MTTTSIFRHTHKLSDILSALTHKQHTTHTHRLIGILSAFFRSPCPHTQLHTQLMKCKRYFLQTIATKMEFALYETSDAHMHTHARRSFKRCHLSASVTKVNIHPDSSQKRDRAKSRGTVVKERKKK